MGWKCESFANEFPRAVSLAESEPGAAIAAATVELSDPANRAHVLNQGMASWARKDLAAASEWLAQRPPGVETDGAIVGMIGAGLMFEPTVSFPWAEVISDPEMRMIQLSYIYQTWKMTDPEAARAAFTELGFSNEEEKQMKSRGVDLSE